MKKVLRISSFEIEALTVIKNAVSWLLFDSQGEEVRKELQYRTYWADATITTEEHVENEHSLRRSIRVKGSMEYVSAIEILPQKLKVHAEYILAATPPAFSDMNWRPHHLILHFVEQPRLSKLRLIYWPQHYEYAATAHFANTSLYGDYPFLRDDPKAVR
jgi:hypothetical protein